MQIWSPLKYFYPERSLKTKPSTTKQVLKDSSKFHRLRVFNTFFKKLHRRTQPLDSLWPSSAPSAHQNNPSGKSPLWQTECLFPTLTRRCKHYTLVALQREHVFVAGPPFFYQVGPASPSCLPPVPAAPAQTHGNLAHAVPAAVGS